MRWQVLLEDGLLLPIGKVQKQVAGKSSRQFPRHNRMAPCSMRSG